MKLISSALALAVVAATVPPAMAAPAVVAGSLMAPSPVVAVKHMKRHKHMRRMRRGSAGQLPNAGGPAGGEAR